MTDSIDQATAHALRIVYAREDHWLPPHDRQRLYQIIDTTPSLPIHRRVRPWLEFLTATHVLPFWETIRTDPQQVWADDYDAPQNMLDFMTAILHQTADLDLARDQANHWLEVADFSAELPNSQFYTAWCVYDAALTALWYLLGGDFFARASLSSGQVVVTDRYGDTANWAAIAYAGGVWQPDPTQEREYDRIVGIWNYDRDETRQRRLQFWEWWLQVAIPTAIAKAHQP